MAFLFQGNAGSLKKKLLQKSFSVLQKLRGDTTVTPFSVFSTEKVRYLTQNVSIKPFLPCNLQVLNSEKNLAA